MAYETGIMIGMIGILFYFLDLMFSLDNEHFPLKSFLFILNNWIMVSIIHLASMIAQDDSAGASVVNAIDNIYYVAVIIAAVFTIYWMLYFMYKVFISFRQDKDSKLKGWSRR